MAQSHEKIKKIPLKLLSLLSSLLTKGTNLILYFMNAIQLSATVHNVNKSLFWAEYCKEKTAKEIKEVERYDNFKFLKDNDLQTAIQTIKDFDINRVWEHSFWKLKKHESICAVATEIYNNIKRIKNENNF